MPHGEESRRLLEFLLTQLQRHRSLPAAPPFPDPESADNTGCVALGSRLSPAMILAAYRRGIFPMAEPDGSFGWWCPDPRTIVDLNDYHVPRRLARTVRQQKYEVRFDTVCPDVIAACADRDETWISPEIEEVYGELFRQGHVHSVESWQNNQLVGGLYGVSIGGAFMAESMFHTARDASKVAVVGLIEHLRARHYALLDIQYQTQATSIFRPKRIPRPEYLRRLQAAIDLPRTFLP